MTTMLSLEEITPALNSAFRFGDSKKYRCRHRASGRRHSTRDRLAQLTQNGRLNAERIYHHFHTSQKGGHSSCQPHSSATTVWRSQPPSRLIRTLGSRLSASSVPPPAFPESKHRLVSRGSTVSVWPRAHLPKASHAFLFTQEG